MKRKNKRCKEYWVKLPFTSEHLWRAGIHGEPQGKCLNCGEDYQNYHRRFDKHLPQIKAWLEEEKENRCIRTHDYRCNTITDG